MFTPMDSSKKILITGGSGLVGKHLTQFLTDASHKVSWLTRNPKIDAVKAYKWDIENNFLDDKAIEENEVIIHLAGASVVGKRWSEQYKKEIYSSRVNSSNLLFSKLQNTQHNIKTIVSASAIGFYGDCGDKLLYENNIHTNDFLGNTCYEWEKAITQIEKLSIRLVILRIGVVLASQGGALAAMAQPIKFFVGAALGNGKSYMSWIHIDDLCSIIMKSIEDNNMHGIFNTVAPQPVTNKEMIHAIAHRLHKPLFMPNIPVFALKIIFGEFGKYLNYSAKVSCNKILQAGYQFKYSTIESALNATYD